MEVGETASLAHCRQTAWSACMVGLPEQGNPSGSAMTLHSSLARHSWIKGGPARPAHDVALCVIPGGHDDRRPGFQRV